MARTLPLTSAMTIAGYVDKNYDKLKSLSSTEAMSIITADIGSIGTQAQIKRVAASIKKPLFTRSQRCSKKFSETSRHDVDAILAKSIQQIANALDIKLDHQDKLTLIIGRYTKNLLDSKE